MNDLILMLRGFSLRWAVVIMFVCSIATGLISIAGGHSLGLTAIVTAISGILLYVTLAVHAIDDDEHAVRISYIMMAANIVSMISGFVGFKDSPDFANTITNDIFSGNNPLSSVEEWVAATVINAAPYTTIMNILMVIAWGLGLKHISKKFTLAWIMGMAAHIIAGIGSLLLFIYGILQYSTFNMLNTICSVITFIFLIALLTINDKKETPNKKLEVKKVTSQEPVSVEQPKTLNKTEQLFKLKELLDSGILTQNEFDSEKKKILNS